MTLKKEEDLVHSNERGNGPKKRMEEATRVMIFQLIALKIAGEKSIKMSLIDKL